MFHGQAFKLRSFRRALLSSRDRASQNEGTQRVGVRPNDAYQYPAHTTYSTYADNFRSCRIGQWCRGLRSDRVDSQELFRGIHSCFETFIKEFFPARTLCIGVNPTPVKRPHGMRMVSPHMATQCTITTTKPFFLFRDELPAFGSVTEFTVLNVTSWRISVWPDSSHPSKLSSIVARYPGQKSPARCGCTLVK